jgi:hypothetical protein
MDAFCSLLQEKLVACDMVAMHHEFNIKQDGIREKDVWLMISWRSFGIFRNGETVGYPAIAADMILKQITKFGILLQPMGREVYEPMIEISQ